MMDFTHQHPTMLPMSRATPDADFLDDNYETFLQDQNMGLMPDESYSSATLSDAVQGHQTPSHMPGASSSDSASPMEMMIAPAQHPQQQQQIQRQQQQPRHKMERKGHTKSRRGCFNCKRRRIKCQETHPACGHCVKTGLKCEYPTAPRIVHQPHHQIPLFSLQDMRFFQHFLMRCYPHHPLGNENIWTHEVPCLSQSHEYLMHSILGLAACDLAAQDSSLLPIAIAHRMKAIKSIKKTLSDMPRRRSNASTSSNRAVTGSCSKSSPDSSSSVTGCVAAAAAAGGGEGTTYEEGNAMIATCFALTFQSVTFDDGMVEYMAFIRGIVVVGMQMMYKGIAPMFNNLMDSASETVLEPFMSRLPLIRQDWADDAVTAIRNLKVLCTDEVEIEYQECLQNMAELLYTSSWEAYRALQKQYGWWIMLPHEKFQRVIDMSNQTMVLLSSHWIALKQIMVFITEHEMDVRQKSPEVQQNDEHVELGMIRWLRWLNKRVEFEHLPYNAWPVWVSDQLDRDISYFGRGVRTTGS